MRTINGKVENRPVMVKSDSATPKSFQALYIRRAGVVQRADRSVVVRNRRTEKGLFAGMAIIGALQLP